MVAQVMVKMDWNETETRWGEPAEKSRLLFAGPLARVPEGPETVHELTLLALQDICELAPA